MPQHVIRLEADGESHYLLWSTIVDAPIAGPLGREAMRGLLLMRHGTDSAHAIDGSLGRADGVGTSEHGADGVEETIGNNRAGLGETCLTMQQIIDVYIRGKPDIEGASTHQEDEDEIEAKTGA